MVDNSSLLFRFGFITDILLVMLLLFTVIFLCFCITEEENIPLAFIGGILIFLFFPVAFFIFGVSYLIIGYTIAFFSLRKK